MGKGNASNEDNSSRELLNQSINSEHWVKKIVVAYLGVKLEQVVVTVKEADR